MQGPLVGCEFGIVEAQCVVADDGFEILPFKGEEELALTVVVVDQRTVVAVNRINRVGVDIRQEAFVLDGIDVLEHLADFIGARVERGRNQVLAANRALQVQRHAAIDPGFFKFLRPGSPQVSFALNLANLGIGQGHDEHGIAGEHDVAVDFASVSECVSNTDGNRVNTRFERHGGDELALTVDFNSLVVDRDGVTRIRETRDEQVAASHYHAVRRQLQHKIRCWLYCQDRSAVVIRADD